MMEYKGKTLVCLVPKEGKSGITSHEKTLCDCEVIELIEVIKDLYEALEFMDENLYKTEIDEYRAMMKDTIKQTINKHKDFLEKLKGE